MFLGFRKPDQRTLIVLGRRERRELCNWEYLRKLELLSAVYFGTMRLHVSFAVVLKNETFNYSKASEHPICAVSS